MIMTVQTSVYAIFAPASPAAERIELKQHEQRCLPIAASRIHVTQGIAWVTSQSEDIIVQAGESLGIPRQRFATIISAVSIGNVTFEIERW
jgi:hypothetical protein